MKLTRRGFLKLTGLVAGAAATSGMFKVGDLLTLRKASAEEIKTLKEQGIEVKYTADVMCPSECGMEMWVKD
ncbi:MAG: twin-arginine translocation signal domain-containing protein, partial [Actinobacteria bacterium]|nr:twin-arginine translocation signal domain-containing protein [Actinomycetota bacterium]